MHCYLIVGGGQAAAWLAKTLRRDNADARIVVVADEASAPYERPPLSKEVLKGEALPESTILLTRAQAAELAIELKTSETVTAIDRAAKTVQLASGARLGYSKLFLATGSRVRRLPLDKLPQERVFYLRTLDDAVRLREALADSQRALIIGGGWIGLEAAAVLRAQGKQVTIIEMGERLCARAAPPVVSEYLQQLHQGRGVDIHTSTRAELSWRDNVIEAHTDKGEVINADLVIVAVGILPNVELAADAGLDVDNGIVVDEFGRTSDAAILAVGDVTNHPSRFLGKRVRLESWDNAQNQAIAVAKAIDSPVDAYAEVPWFWSDQYDSNLQILGQPPQDVTPQRRGDPASGKCLWLFWDGGRVVAAVALNSPRDIRFVKKWMQQGRFPTPDAVADATQKLQKLPLA